MEPCITNVTLLVSTQPKSIKLTNPKEILNSDGGPLLILYMDFEGSHYDLYLYAAFSDSPDHIYIKIDQEILIEYLRGNVALQEVMLSCPKTTFYYEMKKNKISIVFEFPIAMLSNYRVAYSENKLNELQAGIADRDLSKIIECYMNWKDLDPYGQEEWAKEITDYKQISIDASLYFRFKHC